MSPLAYPESRPYDSGHLKVSDLHEIFYMQCGNPEGKPVIYVHGGPAAGVSTSNTVYFNPEVYRIILVDQRGCGNSRPIGEIRENTTWDLVEDFEKIRNHLNIDKWMVFGGSWGSTLSLAYSQTHPTSCTSIIVRGIWYGGNWDTRRWTTKEGTGSIHPEFWDEFVSILPVEDRDNYLQGYRKLFHHDDKAIRDKAFRAWCYWEEVNSYSSPLTPVQMERMEKQLADLEHSKNYCLVETEYFENYCWLEEGQLIRKDNIDKIRHLPGVIIHGRCDTLCPPRNAWELSKAWPEASLHMVPLAGHSAEEPGIRKLLTEYADKFSIY